MSLEVRLRPGLPVVRRDAATLQVGLRPPLAARVPDAPEVRALLDGLRDGLAPADLTATAAETLDRLRAADLVVTAPPVSTPATVAAQALFGADGPRRVAGRAAQPIGVLAEPSSRSVVAELVELAGLLVDDDRPAAWLVVTAGPVRRESIDPLVRAGAPHLLVTGDAGSRRVGPFVEPGHTACLRCVDAHEAESDPRRPFLVEQAARSSALGERVDPVDPVLDRLALAWAVRDLCRYLEGDEPSTWSATVDIGPTEAPLHVRWLRHPHCGCAWDVLFDLP
jgi:hypothetical protein